MKVYIVRHGPAEDQSEAGLDEDRALTVAGRERVHSVAKALLSAGEEPSGIYTSPLVRAVQTAEVLALGTRIGERGGGVAVRRALAPGGPCLALVERLSAEAKRRVMLVGHEPDLSGLVAALLGSPFKVAFEKAMVVGLHVETSGRAHLRFVLEPKSLRFDAPHRT